MDYLAIAVSALFELKKQTSDQMHESGINESHYGYEHWLKEFNTIQISIPRRTGKTRYIAIHADIYTAIIIPHENRRVLIPETDGAVMTTRMLKNRFVMENFNFDKIMVDEPNNTLMSELYSMLDFYQPKLDYILTLGTRYD